MDETMDPVEKEMEGFQRLRFDMSLPPGRWLINRRRRKEGKAPFR